MELGSAAAAPGELARGWFDVADLPTGAPERLPVVVANGAREGPTLWLTGGVHGDEATGITVVQDAMATLDDEDLLAELSGAVVAVPVVSPAGLRRNARHTYYDDEDPNRHFPDTDHESARPPNLQERIDRRLYDAIVGEHAAVSADATADALVDCHTAGVGSEPFVIRDRVLYGDRRDEADAETLADDLAALAEAFGFPVLTEYPAAEYVEENLQRSAAGAVLNEAGIPAVTVELGAHSVVDERLRAGGVAGVFGVGVELGLLETADVPDAVGRPEEYVGPAPVAFPVRRFRGPATDTAGLVRHRVDAGEPFTAGDVVADVVDPTGAPLDTVTVDHDGYVIGRAEGLAAYEGDAVTSLAVRDEGELVVPREGVDDDGDGERD